ncbi:hypothetical protein EVAR_43688_1 [Eumeta japonica]|uniref:Uncharacterized protein n=1 Tax=Eumeta variegata TaxID=151549 RepID=A0A4C1X0Q0_EUMVA|nr:hypothetical protein EVAR_43688_1 [Eumeta japonica]
MNYAEAITCRRAGGGATGFFRSRRRCINTGLSIVGSIFMLSCETLAGFITAERMRSRASRTIIMQSFRPGARGSTTRGRPSQMERRRRAASSRSARPTLSSGEQLAVIKIYAAWLSINEHAPAAAARRVVNKSFAMHLPPTQLCTCCSRTTPSLIDRSTVSAGSRSRRGRRWPHVKAEIQNSRHACARRGLDCDLQLFTSRRLTDDVTKCERPHAIARYDGYPITETE